MDLIVRLVVDAVDAEVAADRLWAEGASAVEVQALRPDQVVLLAGFPTPAAARGVARTLGAEVVEVDDAAWRDVWRQYARPVRVGSMTVVPAWRAVDVAGSAVVLTIDPGRCFGSGSHPTTRLMLGELQRHVTPGATVLDVGTGSGILAVAAAQLGASRVVAVDLDPAAVDVTRRNASANGVADRISVSTVDAGQVGGAFDVVVANLTAAALAALAEILEGAVAPGGVLLLSGMLAGQWRHVAGCFAALSPVDVPVLDGWTGAVLRRT